jgi:hypothetical protein
LNCLVIDEKFPGGITLSFAKWSAAKIVISNDALAFAISGATAGNFFSPTLAGIEANASKEVRVSLRLGVVMENEANSSRTVRQVANTLV